MRPNDKPKYARDGPSRQNGRKSMGRNVERATRCLLPGSRHRIILDFPTTPAFQLNATALASGISAQWDEDIVPQLIDYIRIPAKSPHFDPQWAANGHIERVIRLAEAWVKRQPVRGLDVEIVRLPGRTPLLYF